VPQGSKHKPPHGQRGNASKIGCRRLTNTQQRKCTSEELRSADATKSWTAVPGRSQPRTASARDGMNIKTSACSLLTLLMVHQWPYQMAGAGLASYSRSPCYFVHVGVAGSYQEAWYHRGMKGQNLGVHVRSPAKTSIGSSVDQAVSGGWSSTHIWHVSQSCQETVLVQRWVTLFIPFVG